MAQKHSAGNVPSFLVTAFLFASLRSSVEAGPHKPACEGSTPSAATNVPESSNGRTRGFDPRDEGPNPSSGASTWVWLNGGALGLEPRECEFDSRHPYPCGARHLVMAPVLQTGSGEFDPLAPYQAR